MTNKEILNLIEGFPKSDLIKAYKHYLRENKRFRNRRDGYGKDSGNGLERPSIGGITLSWGQFSKIPKESVFGHVFTEGCDLTYLNSLSEQGFFEKTIAFGKQDGKVYVYYKQQKNSHKGFHWCDEHCCSNFEKHNFIIKLEEEE